MFAWGALFLFTVLAYVENNIFFSWNKYFNISLLPNAILVFNLFFKDHFPALLFIFLYSWVYSFITGGSALALMPVGLLGFYALGFVVSKVTSQLIIFIFVMTIYNLWFFISYLIIKTLNANPIVFSVANKRVLVSYVASSCVSVLILLLYSFVKKDKSKVRNLDNIKDV